MKKQEVILWSVFLLSILGHSFFSLLPILVAFAGLILAFAYFYFSLPIFNGIKIRHTFKRESYEGMSAKRIAYSVLSGVLYSVVVIEIIFKVLHWPGATIMIFMSTFFAVINAVIVFITQKSRPTSVFVRSALQRSIFILFVCILFVGLCMLPREYQKTIFASNRQNVPITIVRSFAFLAQ